VIFPNLDDKDLAMICLTILGTLLMVYLGKDALRILELIVVGILALAGERRVRGE